MTTRKVTVQTEEEQAVEICDHCGLADDDGELVAYAPQNSSDHPGRIDDRLHFHVECLNELGVDVPDGTTYADLVKDTYSESEYPLLAADESDVAFITVGVVLAAVVAYCIGLGLYLLALGGSLLALLSAAAGVNPARQQAIAAKEGGLR